MERRATSGRDADRWRIVEQLQEVRRRGEAKALPTNPVLLVLALVVAILGSLVWS